MNELVFIVEDDPDSAEIFEQSLRGAGFKTEIINNGMAASQRLLETVPHIVVLDIHMPGISGETIFTNIRADERLGKTLVIIVTADVKKAEYFSNSSADFVLVKPISFLELRDLASRLHDTYHDTVKNPDEGKNSHPEE